MQNNDQPAVFYEEGSPSSPLIILADHARNRIPIAIGSLGLSRFDLNRHIAYDPGTEWLARRLAKRLNGHFIYSNFSRLVIDPNRAEDDPTLIMRLSDGALIEGNRHYDAVEKQRRLSLYYRPYHERIDKQLKAISKKGMTPILLSIHSFVPEYAGIKRPWHFALLFDKDMRFTDFMNAVLRNTFPEFTVGLNEPYAGNSMKGDTMARHATAHGYAHTLVEVRNDIIATQEAAEAMAEKLADAIISCADKANEADWLHSMRASW